MDKTEVMMGANVNSVEGLTNQEYALHMGRNVVNERKKVIGETTVTPRRFMKHQLHHQMICY